MITDKRYFKVYDEHSEIENFEEANSIEANDYEDAAEKYAEKYLDQHYGEWDQDDPMEIHICEILKERTYDDREKPKKFEVSYTYYPSFSASEIIDDYEDEGEDE